MKFSLGKMKKWKPVWIGVLAGLGLWMGDVFYRILTTPNTPPHFFWWPYIWLARAILPKHTYGSGWPEHPILFLIAVHLSYFLYFAVLGALAGLLFQGLRWLFRRLKHRDGVCQHGE